MKKVETVAVKVFIEDNYDEKVVALAYHLEGGKTCFSELGYDDAQDKLEKAKDLVDARDYLVLTEEEADDLWDERLDDLIDDCILSQIPEELQMYFDTDLYKRDAQINGSRGENIAFYDGEEHYETVNVTTYYIYRTN